MQLSQPTQPEHAPETGGVEVPTPQAAGQAAQAPAAQTTPAPVTVPSPKQSGAPDPKPATPTSTSPANAEDVDVIEKEWVDAAEVVVKKHADDPHAEEEGFENLQVDYLKKRYGKDIQKPKE